MKPTYGRDRKGKEIKPPKGYRLLNQGDPVPPIHVEFFGGNEIYTYGIGWQFREGRSTMTPIYADVWGLNLAYAVPDI